MPSLAPGYWFCFSDATGVRISGAEIQLTPAPARIELPFEALGTIVETADGNAIKQQPSKDPRVRTWTWKNFPAWHIAYQRLWQQLLTFNSVTRFKSGLSPFVFLLDNASGKAERRYAFKTSVASAGASTVTTSSALPSTLPSTGAAVEVVSGPGAGQVGYVNSVTGNQLTVSPAWTTLPTALSTVVVRYQVADWFRVRVLHVDRRAAEDRATQYEETKISFVVDDSGWNDV